MRGPVQIIAFCILVGCSKDPEPEPLVPFDLPAPSARPVDHLAPDELTRGTERAFALVLPRGFAVRARFGSSVLAEGPATAQSLARYLAEQVKDGDAKVQPQRATFTGVRAIEEPARVLKIRVEETSVGNCQLQINDETPPPDPGGSVEERMKRVGRSADGTWHDRNKLE